MMSSWGRVVRAWVEELGVRAELSGLSAKEDTCGLDVSL